MPAFRKLVLAAALAAALPSHGDELAKGFADPPESARPRVWWHWMNGNVTKAGIKADLEWMHRVGLGGVQMFDADIGTAQYVPERVGFMTPTWLDHVRYAVTEADRLGLEFTMTPTSGWSQSGGPWVTPAQGMKKYVWSETVVTGGRRFSGKLVAPPGGTGPFQDIAFQSHSDNLPMPNGSPGALPYVKPALAPQQWYADAAVIAYRAPEGEATPVPVAVTSSSGALDGARLADHAFGAPQALNLPPEGRAWVQLDFGKPVRAQAVNLGLASGLVPNGAVLASDDGVTFRSRKRGRAISVSSSMRPCAPCSTTSWASRKPPATR
jgi:hypothetical protein